MPTSTSAPPPTMPVSSRWRWFVGPGVSASWPLGAAVTSFGSFVTCAVRGGGAVVGGGGVVGAVVAGAVVAGVGGGGGVSGGGGCAGSVGAAGGGAVTPNSGPTDASSAASGDWPGGTVAEA